jgi:hypothetical protein
VTILLVEQNARAALEVADYGYVLEMGEIALEGPAEELANRPARDRHLSGREEERLRTDSMWHIRPLRWRTCASSSSTCSTLPGLLAHRCPAFADLDADIAREVLQQAARFATEVLVPTNGPIGDKRGLHAGATARCVTPRGYPAAYRAFVEAAGRRWPVRPRSAARACRTC